MKCTSTFCVKRLNLDKMKKAKLAEETKFTINDLLIIPSIPPPYYSGVVGVNKMEAAVIGTHHMFQTMPILSAQL